MVFRAMEFSDRRALINAAGQNPRNYESWLGEFESIDNHPFDDKNSFPSPPWIKLIFQRWFKKKREEKERKKRTRREERKNERNHRLYSFSLDFWKRSRLEGIIVYTMKLIIISTNMKLERWNLESFVLTMEYSRMHQLLQFAGNYLW